MKKHHLLAIAFLTFFSLLHCTKDDFVFISVAKSGTHLVNNCIYELTAKKRAYTPDLEYLKVNSSNPSVYIGTHIGHLKVVDTILKSKNYKKIIVNIRDPRSVILSGVNYYTGYLFIDLKAKNDVSELFSFDKLTISSRLFSVLYHAIHTPYSYVGVYEFQQLQNFIDKAKKHGKEILITRFENLVGASGGGSEQLQVEEIKKISKFLNLSDRADTDYSNIANKIFGHSPTFRKGKIRGWQKYFTPAHKALFNRLLGKELIELGYEKSLEW